MSELASFNPPPGNPGARTRRYVIATITLLLLGLVATQLFLHQTSVGSPRFVRMTIILWAATVLVILALLVLATVLGRNLIKLYFERKSGQVGSQFKSKMVSTFVLLSLLPAVLLFVLAYGLVNISIEQWFGAPAAQMLENSHSIAVQYYDEIRERLTHYGVVMASGVSPEEISDPGQRIKLEQHLLELVRTCMLEGARVFDTRGALVAESGNRLARDSHKEKIGQLVESALAGRQGFAVELVTPKDVVRELAWTAVPIYGPDGRVRGSVLCELLIPHSVHFKASSVAEAYSAYSQLEREKAQVRFNFLLILALATLLIVFSFSWFAMYLAKRITTPIQALAEGAAEVAKGNLAHRVVCEAIGELGSLVTSFNQMTGDLLENKERIEAAQTSLRQTNVELDDRRRYIETILQTIATGVVSLDKHYCIRTINPAAMQMLEYHGSASDVLLDDVVKGSAGNTLKLLLHKSTVLGPVARTIELPLPGKTLHLATTITPLVDSAGTRTGWVVVLDDVTELLRIEKMTAWQEVARRMAHEIKNPLTPIQLSAERLLKRYKQIMTALPPERKNGGNWQAEFRSFDALLEECTGAITCEASSLKNLVNEFSRFARLPEVRLQDSDLHRILDGTLSLYDGRIQDVRLVKVFGTDIPVVRLDPEHMRRVFINLFDNALEAMSDNTHAKVLQVCTSCSAPRAMVRIEISDTGRGFPKEYQDSLFLPYFSTRKEGTGLGLAIVRQIITDHHGYVRAEPNVPVGTRIIIDLPLVPA
jgi:two-component system, NtrC family, nitrogen regulation sensor histidine kinase NtrY